MGGTRLGSHMWLHWAEYEDDLNAVLQKAREEVFQSGEYHLLPKPKLEWLGKPIDPDNMEGLVSAVHHEGTINNPRDIDSFWSVEIAMPLKAFEKYGSGPVEPGSKWRINFSRVQWPHLADNQSYIKEPGASENNWVWSPQHVINMHRPERWGYLFFTDRNSRIFPDMSEYRLAYYAAKVYDKWKKSKKT